MGGVTGCALCSGASVLQVLNSLRGIMSALGGFPGQIGWRLYLVVSGPMDYTPCLVIAGEAAMKMVKFFVVLTQDLTLHPMFPEQIEPWVLFSKLLALPASQLDCPWASQSPGLSLVRLVRYSWKMLPSGRGYAWAPLPTRVGKGSP